MCFMNAYHLARERGFTYCEGLALNLIPTLHAWVLDAKGGVIETTWKEPGDEYYGIEFPMPFIESIMLETEIYGVINLHSRIIREKFFPEVGK